MGLFVGFSDFAAAEDGDIPEWLQLDDDTWLAELRFGTDLFANWCDDVVEPGEPTPAVGETWQLSGTIEIDELPSAEHSGPASATLTGVEGGPNNELIAFDVFEMENQFWAPSPDNDCGSPAAAYPPGMEQRLSLVTLGVGDLELSRTFYRNLGWKEHATSSEDVAFFQAGGIVFGLWDRKQLAEDSAVEDGKGWGGVTLAYNTRSEAQVDAVIEEARFAGATIGREPAETFWGGYSGVFRDPDGHPWEVAYNPDWEIDDDGAITLPEG